MNICIRVCTHVDERVGGREQARAVPRKTPTRAAHRRGTARQATDARHGTPLHFCLLLIASCGMRHPAHESHTHTHTGRRQSSVPTLQRLSQRRAPGGRGRVAPAARRSTAVGGGIERRRFPPSPARPRPPQPEGLWHWLYPPASGHRQRRRWGERRRRPERGGRTHRGGRYAAVARPPPSRSLPPRPSRHRRVAHAAVGPPPVARRTAPPQRRRPLGGGGHPQPRSFGRAAPPQSARRVPPSTPPPPRRPPSTMSQPYARGATAQPYCANAHWLHTPYAVNRRAPLPPTPKHYPQVPQRARRSQLVPPPTPPPPAPHPPPPPPPVPPYSSSQASSHVSASQSCSASWALPHA